MIFCCNPFNESGHKPNKAKSTTPRRVISKSLASNALKIDIRLEAEVAHICDPCRRKIYRDIELEDQRKAAEKQRAEEREAQRSHPRDSHLEAMLKIAPKIVPKEESMEVHPAPADTQRFSELLVEAGEQQPSSGSEDALTNICERIE